MSKHVRTDTGRTRRDFVQAGGATLATLAIASPATAEPLAMDGGSQTVVFPVARQTALSRWPRYGAKEKQVLHDLIDSNKFYEELPAFESEWQQYTKSPFVKAHKLTPRTKAVVAMHSWGLPCEMDKSRAAWVCTRRASTLSAPPHSDTTRTLSSSPRTAPFGRKKAQASARSSECIPSPPPSGACNCGNLMRSTPSPAGTSATSMTGSPTEQHKLKIYSEAKWWHHKPTIPQSMPGNEQVNKTYIFLPIPYGDAPELLHRKDLGKQS